MKIKWEKVHPQVVWNRVKSLRKSIGLNQTQVAAGAGISVPTLWMIESGFDEKTTEETKKKLADFFNCDVDDIFPVEMIGNVPREYPKEKQTIQLQFFTKKE